RVVMLSLDKDSGRLASRMERTREGTAVERHPIPRRVLRQVIDEKQAVIFGGVDAGRGLVSGTFSSSMLCAPLVVRGEVLGAIHVTGIDAVTPFLAADLDLLVGISSQAAIALKSADLHAKLMERERVRYDIRVAQEIQ